MSTSDEPGRPAAEPRAEPRRDTAADTLSTAQRAELERLALLLRADLDDVAFLARFDAAALRALRTSVSQQIATENRAAYQRIAVASRLMPARATAAVAMKRMPPRLSAAVVGDMPPEHAADLAAAMRPDYLRQVCRHLSPTAAADVGWRLPDDVLSAVLDELLAHRDAVTMAEVVGTLDDDQIRTCVAAFDDDDDDMGLLVEMTLGISDAAAVQRLLRVLPQQTLRAMLEHARRTPGQETEMRAVLTAAPPDVGDRAAGLDG